MDTFETSLAASNAEGAVRFKPTASIVNLKRRAALCKCARAFFDARDFVEVATPTLSRDVVVDRFVEAIRVDLDSCWREPDAFAQSRFHERSLERANAFYLQTSPEFAMKRLLASGMDAIYQLAPAFRRGDRGAFHNVEFTMLEWYRGGVDYRGGRRLLAEFVENVARDFYRATSIDPQTPFRNCVQERPFADAFEEKTQIDPIARDDVALRNALQDAIRRQEIPCPTSYLERDSDATNDDLIDLLFSELVQPSLGTNAPIILYDYPGSQSQLAKTQEQENGRVARRFELFVDGVELANGYDELVDPNVLRARVERVSEERKRDGAQELPKESRLLAAMDAGYPDSSGCALGIDRFLMTLLGVDSIDAVLAFPIEIA